MLCHVFRNRRGVEFASGQAESLGEFVSRLEEVVGEGDRCFHTGSIPQYDHAGKLVRAAPQAPREPLGDALHSGYLLARMRFDIVLAPEAVRQLRALRSHVRAEVRDAIERHLRHEPEKLSRSRIRRLRGLARPQYRLRVGKVRVFYDVEEDRVEVLAIIDKAQAAAWLEEEGEGTDEGGRG